MKELSKNEMLKIDGGLNVTGTLISTLIKGSELFFNFGKSFGISVKRFISSRF